MQEIWKDIVGYEGRYMISNKGRVKSFARPSSGTGRLLTPYITRGYCSVGLTDSNGNRRTFLVHRLVAKAFIPNPQGYAEVNHKDENKQNNACDNLEWCTREYNMSYGNARLRQGISYGKPVDQIALDGSVIARYCSAEFASMLTGTDASSIHKCCKGKRKYANGYEWQYSNSF